MSIAKHMEINFIVAVLVSAAAAYATAPSQPVSATQAIAAGAGKLTAVAPTSGAPWQFKKLASMPLR